MLERAIAHSTTFKKVVVLDSTESTQDVARAADLNGTIVIAWRQTAGRGRLGRSWLDTGEDGLALSCALPRMEGERVSIQVALAAAIAIERACTDATATAPRVGLKWPNDLFLAGKKIGGVLIERESARTVIGIGINCTQSGFPQELAHRASSLAMAGFHIDRIDLAVALVEELDSWLSAADERIEEAYGQRDTMCNSTVKLSTPDGIIEGLVVRVDPLAGLMVRTSRGDVFLPAATTSVFVPEDRLAR